MVSLRSKKKKEAFKVKRSQIGKSQQREINTTDINEMIIEMAEYIPKLKDPSIDSEEKVETIVEFLSKEHDDDKIVKGLILLSQLLIYVN